MALPSWLERLLAGAADVKNTNSITLDEKKNPVHMRLTTVEQLPHFERKSVILGSNHTALMPLLKALNRRKQPAIPERASKRRGLGHPLIKLFSIR